MCDRTRTCVMADDVSIILRIYIMEEYNIKTIVIVIRIIFLTYWCGENIRDKIVLAVETGFRSHTFTFV